MVKDGSLPPAQQNLDLGVVGNGAIAALIDRNATIVWGCFPRFDSPPTFCSLLMGSAANQHGFYSIEIVGQTRSTQRYLPNSAVLETVLYDDHGAAVRITDFAPRYHRHHRVFHPTMLIRQVECISGMPRLIVRMRPATSNGAKPAERIRGSNHIRFETDHMALRMTTDGPASLIFEETPFVLQHPITMILGPDESLQDPVAVMGRDLFSETMNNWQEWIRRLALPFEWQDVVIRAAITLKLCAFEETGGIVAALTTSIPEYANTPRTWDYRFCWLRDAFFVVQALNRLGAVQTMENYIGYVKNLVAATHGKPLQPLYGIAYESEMQETSIPHLRGYRDNGPVRFGNAAYTQIQNDSYGNIILALAQSFFDLRLNHSEDRQLFALLENLGDEAVKVWNQPDAGLWEYRNLPAVHTYSAAMCWAGCDRLAKIAEHLNLEAPAQKWAAHAATMQTQILAQAWNDSEQSFSSTFGGANIDASLLLLPEIGMIDINDPRFLKTVANIEKQLRHDHVLFRYRHADDFGLPETSFTVCTLWYVRTLHRLGRRDEAREVFEHLLKKRNHLGLLSEDIHPATGELWGNFPQTYSMVGLIQAARTLSRPWELLF
ncbi:MAG: glycoside hydrolase family 15 protein [Alphaproteobacteria bacterium]